MAILGLALCFPAGREALAQVGTGSNLGTVALAATNAGGISVTIQSGATQSIASIVDGTANPFSAPVQIFTQWNVNPGQASAVTVVAYFSTPSQALVSGPNAIPSSWIEGRVATGLPTAFTPISGATVAGRTQTAGTAGGTLTLFSQPINGQTKVGDRTDNLELRLNLTGRRTTPGTYTGTLNIRAIVQ